jgi:hypothetical protein
MSFSFKALASLVAAVISFATAATFGAAAAIARNSLYTTCSAMETAWYIFTGAFVLVALTYVAQAHIAHEFHFAMPRRKPEPVVAARTYSDDPFDIL